MQTRSSFDFTTQTHTCEERRGGQWGEGEGKKEEQQKIKNNDNKKKMMKRQRGGMMVKAEPKLSGGCESKPGALATIFSEAHEVQESK